MKVVDIAPKKKEEGSSLLTKLEALTAAIEEEGGDCENAAVILLTVDRTSEGVTLRHTSGMIETLGYLEIAKSMIVSGEFN